MKIFSIYMQEIFKPKRYNNNFIQEASYKYCWNLMTAWIFDFFFSLIESELK